MDVEMKLDSTNFPSEDVDEKAFKTCFFRFKEELYSASTEMKKNELALRIAVSYYNEGFSKRAIDLAEYMYYRVSENYQAATIPTRPQAQQVQPKPAQKNPYSKYRI